MRAAELCFVILTAATLAGCGSPSEPADLDSDGDGLLDAEETAGWQITIDYLNHRSVYAVTSDPQKSDTDGDGVTDLYERALGRDPSKADSDEDGLSDCEEDRHTNRAQCEDASYTGPWDGGYLTDGGRADSDPGYGRYVNRPGGYADESGTLQRPVSWGDGISDGDELRGYEVHLYGGATRRVTTDPMLKDSDGDLLEDGEEAYFYQTDPTVTDSDGDGCRDGLDVFPEADVRLGPGMANFTWKGASPARIQFEIGVATSAVLWPDTPLQVQPGQRLALAGLSQPVFKVDCTFFAFQPWVNLDVRAVWTDHSGGPVSVDLSSDSAAAVGGHTRYWNPRTASSALSLTGDGAAPGAVRLEGADAAIDLAPQARLSSGKEFKQYNQNP